MSLAVLALLGLSPVGNAFMLPLENRFPAWVCRTECLTGSSSVARSTRPARTSRRCSTRRPNGWWSCQSWRGYPNARILFSGGNSALMDGGSAEAEFAARLLESLGVERSRITLEDRSRNTVENAVFSKALIQPKSGDRWLLVTSAYHMPRAIGVFRKGGLSGRTLSGRSAHTCRRGCAVAICDHERRAAADRHCLHEWIGLSYIGSPSAPQSCFRGQTRGGRRKELLLSMKAISFPATDGFPHFSCYWHAHVFCSQDEAQ